MSLPPPHYIDRLNTIEDYQEIGYEIHDALWALFVEVFDNKFAPKEN